MGNAHSEYKTRPQRKPDRYIWKAEDLLCPSSGPDLRQLEEELRRTRLQVAHVHSQLHEALNRPLPAAPPPPTSAPEEAKKPDPPKLEKPSSAKMPSMRMPRIPRMPRMPRMPQERTPLAEKSAPAPGKEKPHIIAHARDRDSDGASHAPVMPIFMLDATSRSMSEPAIRERRRRAYRYNTSPADHLSTAPLEMSPALEASPAAPYHNKAAPALQHSAHSGLVPIAMDMPWTVGTPTIRPSPAHSIPHHPLLGDTGRSNDYGDPHGRLVLHGEAGRPPWLHGIEEEPPWQISKRPAPPDWGLVPTRAADLDTAPRRLALPDPADCPADERELEGTGAMDMNAYGFRKGSPPVAGSAHARKDIDDAWQLDGNSEDADDANLNLRDTEDIREEQWNFTKIYSGDHRVDLPDTFPDHSNLDHMYPAAGFPLPSAGVSASFDTVRRAIQQEFGFDPDDGEEELGW